MPDLNLPLSRGEGGRFVVIVEKKVEEVKDV
jgi:hypothetical protein